MKDYSKKIKDLTIELGEISSVVGTKEENDVVDRIYEKFSEMKYFKEHPDKVKYVGVENDILGGVCQVSCRIFL